MIVAGTARIVGYWIVMLVRYRGSGSWPITSGRIESYDRPSYMGDFEQRRLLH